MTRKPLDIVNFNLRIRESLRAKLARAAEKNRTSLNNEIRLRLEASLEKAAVRDLDTIAADMKERYYMLGQFWRRLDLEERLARALAAGDFEKAKPLASAWLEQRRES
jgi:Arc-like DNA binding domain